MKKFIRDPLYKNIDISEPIINELIKTKEFQRLRYIHQLSGAKIIFPSATHTRFTHSLGVYNLVKRILSEVSGKENITKEKKNELIIAGLLHDIGHGPFSHSFEKIVVNEKGKTILNHEKYTCLIIDNQKTQINQVLKKYQINIENVKNLITKKDINASGTNIISSQLDCDRMDYLLRDSYFAGVNYGNIDLDWIISNVIYYQDGFYFNYRAKEAIENFLLARFHMYQQIYHHKISLSFDVLLNKFFLRLFDLNKINYQFQVDLKLINFLLNKDFFNIDSYLKLNEYNLYHLIKSISDQEKDKILKNLSQRIIDFNFFQIKESLNELKKDSKFSEKNEEWKKYYFSENKYKIDLYNFKKDQIMIISENNQIQNFEEISYLLKIYTKNKNLIKYEKKYYFYCFD